MAASYSKTHAGAPRRDQTGGYLPIEDYGMIGNMNTCALVGVDGSIDFMCWPAFDSPSVFCRLLDKDKGGYFDISPPAEVACTTKQQYLPSSCILRTRSIHEDGVVDLIDFFPRPKSAKVMTRDYIHGAYREATNVQEELKRWLVRRVECIRGSLTIDVEIFPSFEYGLAAHETILLYDTYSPGVGESKMASFRSRNVQLQLDVALEKGDDDAPCPTVSFKKERRSGLRGDGLVARVRMQEGQAMSFVLRQEKPDHITKHITPLVLDQQQHDTQSFWHNFIAQSKYNGRWMEVVSRSLMILKMMTYGVYSFGKPTS
jgi:GH15 family glucan-1,4-alpha-glucosidase